MAANKCSLVRRPIENSESSSAKCSVELDYLTQMALTNLYPDGVPTVLYVVQSNLQNLLTCCLGRIVVSTKLRENCFKSLVRESRAFEC